jgi:hypothetical protein
MNLTGDTQALIKLKVLVRPQFCLKALVEDEHGGGKEDENEMKRPSSDDAEALELSSSSQQAASLRIHRDLLLARESEINDLKDDNMTLKSTLKALQSEIVALGDENTRLRIQKERELAEKNKELAAKDREIALLKVKDREKEQELAAKEQVMIQHWLQEQLAGLSTAGGGDVTPPSGRVTSNGRKSPQRPHMQTSTSSSISSSIHHPTAMGPASRSSTDRF